MRRHLPVVAVAALVVLGGCTGGGGGGGNAAPTTLPEAVAPAPAEATTTTTPGVIETFEVFSTKNPFIPLAGDQAGGAAGGGTTGTTAPSTGGGATGGTAGGGTTGGTGTSDGTTAGVEPQRAQRVALQDVFTEGGEVKANVRVNSTVYKVTVGEEFADRYKVLSLDQGSECGRFLFGDDSFRLCRGEQALK
jgi:hypothetical protein